MAVVLGYPGLSFWQAPELGVDTKMILHGETEIVLHRPLPAENRIVGFNNVAALEDKGEGKACFVRLVRKLFDGTGNLLATVNNASFLRGHGGFGGSRGKRPAAPSLPEGRGADERDALPTLPTQALIYRLSGDSNALHIDPAVAKAAGFERPILHGLSTFGVAGRALLRAQCDNDPRRMRRIGVRFSSPVYPSETIVTETWRSGAGHAAFRATVAECNVVVLDQGYVEFA